MHRANLCLYHVTLASEVFSQYTRVADDSRKTDDRQTTHCDNSLTVATVS